MQAFLGTQSPVYSQYSPPVCSAQAVRLLRHLVRLRARLPAGVVRRAPGAGHARRGHAAQLLLHLALPRILLMHAGLQGHR